MTNCVRHEGIGEEVAAKWPKRASKFCTEGCAALYGLEVVTETAAPDIVEKNVGGARGHAKGHTTNRPPGDPSQAIPKTAPVAVATDDGNGDDGDDGIVQADGLDDMTKDALKSECENLGLPVSGTKDDLIARIRDHHDAD